MAKAILAAFWPKAVNSVLINSVSVSRHCSRCFVLAHGGAGASPLFFPPLAVVRRPLLPPPKEGEDVDHIEKGYSSLGQHLDRYFGF